MHRPCRRIRVRIGERRLIVHDRGRRGSGRDDERLELNRPMNVPVPLPCLFVSMSPSYQDRPKGALGTWMTKKSNSLLAGSPLTRTRIFSTGPSDLISTRARACGRHPALATAADRTIVNLISSSRCLPRAGSDPPTAARSSAAIRANPSAFQCLRARCMSDHSLSGCFQGRRSLGAGSAVGRAQAVRPGRAATLPARCDRSPMKAQIGDATPSSLPTRESRVSRCPEKVQAKSVGRGAPSVRPPALPGPPSDGGRRAPPA
jgi:hypothetical protein